MDFFLHNFKKNFIIILNVGWFIGNDLKLIEIYFLGFQKVKVITAATTK